ncbi:hypothetical protein JCM10207_001432 [Rhodosporidiobolus poonsookiae]
MPYSTGKSKEQMRPIVGQIAEAARGGHSKMMKAHRWSDSFKAVTAALSTREDNLSRQEGALLIDELKGLLDRVYADELTLAQLPHAEKGHDNLFHPDAAFCCQQVFDAISHTWSNWENLKFATSANGARHLEQHPTVFSRQRFEPFVVRFRVTLDKLSTWDREARAGIIRALQEVLEDFQQQGPSAVVLNTNNPLVKALEKAAEHPRTFPVARLNHLQTLFRGLHRACQDWRPADASPFGGAPGQLEYNAQELGNLQFSEFAKQAEPLVLQRAEHWDAPGYKGVLNALRLLIRAAKEEGGIVLEWTNVNTVPHAIKEADARVARGHPSTSHSLGQLHHRQQRVYAVSLADFAARLAARGMRSF